VPAKGIPIGAQVLGERRFHRNEEKVWFFFPPNQFSSKTIVIRDEI